MHLVKRIFKIGTLFFLVLFIAAYLVFVRFSSPKSDVEIHSLFHEAGVPAFIKQNKLHVFDYRKIAMQKAIDTSKVTLVFVHGAIGSAIDFKNYMTDSLMRSAYNMVSYDRVGYNYNSTVLAQKSLKFEMDVLQDVVQNLKPEKTILVGYSYGGPIVLGVKKRCKQLVLLAPAVYSAVEPMPCMLHFYESKYTRWLVPHVWQSASVEKQTHKTELQKYEEHWIENSSPVMSIHGTSDGIVPYVNSLFLQEQFPEKQFVLKTIHGAGHSLVWSHEQFIKNELLKLAH